DTSTRSTATPAPRSTATISGPAPGQALLELDELSEQRLLDHAHSLGVALDHRLGHLLGLHPRDVRRERGDLRVDLDLEHARPAGFERGLPGLADLVRAVAVDPREAAELGELVVREVRNPLRRRELRVAREHALLPRDLVEVLVVEDAEDEA